MVEVLIAALALIAMPTFLDDEEEFFFSSKLPLSLPTLVGYSEFKTPMPDTDVLAQGMLTLTKSGFTLLQNSFLLGSLLSLSYSLSVCAQVRSGKG